MKLTIKIIKYFIRCYNAAKGEIQLEDLVRQGKANQIAKRMLNNHYP